MRSAAGLCAVSKYTAEVTRSVMRLGTRPIEIIYNPVNLDEFYPRPETIIDGRIVFAGSIVEKKGIRELCHSLRYVICEFPRVELLVAGRDCRAPDGSHSFTQQILDGLDLQSRQHIRFLGPLPLSEVSRLMASAHVCVFPSYMETQGVVIAEAMGCGRPVIVTSRGPGPEVLGEDEGCGLLVDPFSTEDIARKLCDVLRERDTAERMGRNGRLRAETKFSVEKLVDKNLRFYEKFRYRTGTGSEGNSPRMGAADGLVQSK